MSRNIFTVVLSAGLLVAVTASVSADPAADYYLDPTHWKNMDWGQPGNSPLWQLPGWEADPEKLPSGGTRIKKRTIVVDGIKFDANWSTAKANDKRSLSSGFIRLDLSSKECLQVAQTLHGKFGPPIINDGTINLSFSPNDPLHMVQIDYQWDLGNTRVSASCFGMTSRNSSTGVEEGTGFLWNVVFTSTASKPKLIPKFALRCSQQGQVPGGKIFDLGELPLWVDLYNKRITNAFGILLSDQKSFKADDSVIEFTVSKKITSSPRSTFTHYSIYRMTGAIEGTVSQKGLPDVRISGTCTKTTSLQRKF